MSHIHHECELERHIVEQLAASGWQVGDPGQYDKLRALNGANAESTVLDRLSKAWMPARERAVLWQPVLVPGRP